MCNADANMISASASVATVPRVLSRRSVGRERHSEPFIAGQQKKKKRLNKKTRCYPYADMFCYHVLYRAGTKQIGGADAAGMDRSQRS